MRNEEWLGSHTVSTVPPPRASPAAACSIGQETGPHWTGDCQRCTGTMPWSAPVPSTCESKPSGAPFANAAATCPMKLQQSRQPCDIWRRQTSGLLLMRVPLTHASLLARRQRPPCYTGSCVSIVKHSWHSQPACSVHMNASIVLRC